MANLTARPGFAAEELIAWFHRLRESTITIASLADYDGLTADATYILERSLEKPELLAFLGAPDANVAASFSGSRDAPYTQWLHALWGRRCATYFGAVASGLRTSCAVNARSSSLFAGRTRVGAIRDLYDSVR